MSKEYTIPVLKPGWPKTIGDLRVVHTNLYYPHVEEHMLVGEQVYAFSHRRSSLSMQRQEGEDLEIFF